MRLWIFLFIGICLVSNQEIPGNPVFLTLPLNSSGYEFKIAPTGNSSSTPVHQIAFFVPPNARIITIVLDLVDNPNGTCLVDYSTIGPLCQYQYQLGNPGFFCGGINSPQMLPLQTNQTFQFSPAGGGRPGFRWRVQSYFFFGITASNSNPQVPIHYTIRSINIDRCSDGQIGGQSRFNSSITCLPLITIPTGSTAVTFTYNPTNIEGIVFAFNVAPSTGLMQVMISVKDNSFDATTKFDARGASKGFPSLANECDAPQIQSVSNVTELTYTCGTPSPGPFYLYFYWNQSRSFDGQITISSLQCDSDLGGPTCTSPVTSLQIPNAGQASNSELFLIPSGSPLLFQLQTTMTNYSVDVSFAGSGLDVYLRPDSYASNNVAIGGYPNANYHIDGSQSNDITFHFQRQQLYYGYNAYFTVYAKANRRRGTVFSISIQSGLTDPSPASSTLSSSRTATSTSTFPSTSSSISSSISISASQNNNTNVTAEQVQSEDGQGNLGAIIGGAVGGAVVAAGI